jgi:hypothetical protein
MAERRFDWVEHMDGYFGYEVIVRGRDITVLMGYGDESGWDQFCYEAEENPKTFDFPSGLVEDTGWHLDGIDFLEGCLGVKVKKTK